ncbi:MAG: hypothetical protein U0165_20635, partial [Polyangiaceae bacterium]
AQDELQVAEHPLLGSVREALIALKRAELAPTTQIGVTPTPVLVRGVERRASIATEPDLEANRPLGLYGNAFRRASDDAVRGAIALLAPTTFSNIVAIEAPYARGVGRYSREDLVQALTVAKAGFSAVAQESSEAGAKRIELHTGHWGTGVYGGDRVGMALVQLIAASLVGIDEVVFHAFDQQGVAHVQQAEKYLDQLMNEPASKSLERVVDVLESFGFRWGEGDGN